MIQFRKPFALTAFILMISAICHLAVLIVGMGQYVIPMLIGAVTLYILAFGINRTGSRLLAALTFLIAAFFGAFTLGFTMNASGLTETLLFVVVSADGLAALLLFGILWRSPKPAKA